MSAQTTAEHEGMEALCVVTLLVFSEYDQL